MSLFLGPLCVVQYFLPTSHSISCSALPLLGPLGKGNKTPIISKHLESSVAKD